MIDTVARPIGLPHWWQGGPNRRHKRPVSLGPDVTIEVDLVRQCGTCRAGHPQCERRTRQGPNELTPHLSSISICSICCPALFVERLPSSGERFWGRGEIQIRPRSSPPPSSEEKEKPSRHCVERNLFSADGTAVEARHLRRFNARLPIGY